MVDGSLGSFSQRDNTFYLATPQDEQKFVTQAREHQRKNDEIERIRTQVRRKERIKGLQPLATEPEAGKWLSWARETGYGTGRILAVDDKNVAVITVYGKEMSIPVSGTVWGRDSEAENAHAKEEKRKADELSRQRSRGSMGR